MSLFWFLIPHSEFRIPHSRQFRIPKWKDRARRISIDRLRKESELRKLEMPQKSVRFSLHWML